VHLIASLHGDEVLRPGLGPHHRAAQLPGGGGHRHVLDPPSALGPKSAAHPRGNHPDLIEVQSQRLGDAPSGGVGPLGGNPQGELLPGGISEHGVGLHRHHRHPIVNDAGTDGPVCPVVQAIHRIEGPEHRVRTPFGIEHRCTIGHCGLGVHRHRERLIVDHDLVGRVLGCGQALSDHHGHRLAHKADPFAGQRPTYEVGIEREPGLHLLHPNGLGGVYRGDTTVLGGGSQIDRFDEGMSHRRAHEVSLEQPFGPQIPGEATLPG